MRIVKKVEKFLRFYFPFIGKDFIGYALHNPDALGEGIIGVEAVMIK